jgi:hypothetical protein
MAVKAKRIKCARCGERETMTRGERGPASICCDFCRDEVKREQAALRAQAYRQRRRLSGYRSPIGTSGTHYRIVRRRSQFVRSQFVRSLPHQPTYSFSK